MLEVVVVFSNSLAEVLVEEVQRLPAITHGVGVDLLLAGDVRPVRVL